MRKLENKQKIKLVKPKSLDVLLETFSSVEPDWDKVFDVLKGMVKQGRKGVDVGLVAEIDVYNRLSSAIALSCYDAEINSFGNLQNSRFKMFKKGVGYYVAPNDGPWLCEYDSLLTINSGLSGVIGLIEVKTSKVHKAASPGKKNSTSTLNGCTTQSNIGKVFSPLKSLFPHYNFSYVVIANPSSIKPNSPVQNSFKDVGYIVPLCTDFDYYGTTASAIAKRFNN